MEYLCANACGLYDMFCSYSSLMRLHTIDPVSDIPAGNMQLCTATFQHQLWHCLYAPSPSSADSTGGWNGTRKGHP